jgi:hypothetical protein
MATEEEIDRLRYTTENGVLTYSAGVGVSLFDSLPTLEDQLSFWGFDGTEIQNIMNKINAVDALKSIPTSVTTTDPLTNQPKTNVNGSLVSNSAQSLKNTTEFQKATIELEKQKVQSMIEANRISQMKLVSTIDSNTLQEASQILAAEQYIVSTQILDSLKDIKTALTNQKLTSSVNIDTTKLVEANQTIASGVENQLATNAKIVENLTKQNLHYDFLTKGVSTLKDSNGNAIIPQEVQARINAEKLIEQEDMNRTTIDELMEFIPDLVAGATNEVGELLGTTDGFDLDFNPMSYIDEILMKDFQQHKDNYHPENKA